MKRVKKQYFLCLSKETSSILCFIESAQNVCLRNSVAQGRFTLSPIRPTPSVSSLGWSAFISLIDVSEAQGFVAETQ